MHVSAYRSEDRADWDAFVRTAKNGHFMFLRDYMDYHAARFPDASLMFYDDRGRLVGLLPATVRDGVMSSHAGLSFGGVISGRDMKAGLMLELFSAMCAHVRGRGNAEVVYKPVPHIYHEVPAEEDLYALFRCNARLIRRDVSATIGARQRLPFSKGRAHGRNQAEKSGLAVEPSTDFDAFMALQEEVLRTRHNARPTHSASELALLAGRFPDNIRLFVARQGNEMLGGVVIYETARVAHTQYICASKQGRRLGALDLIFQHLINERYADRDHFDFGISSDDGRLLNAGLLENKESYGARATVFDWYAFDPAVAFERLAGHAR